MAKELTTCLGVLQRLRSQREAVARQAFLRCQAEAQAVRSRIGRLERALRQQAAECRRHLLEGARPAAAGASRRDLAEIRAAIWRESARLAGLAESLRSRREQLLAARRQREAIDWLRRKRQVKADLALRRLAVRELDDMQLAHAATRQSR